MSKLFKLLIKDPVDDLERIEEITESGGYIYPLRILHDERKDGPLPQSKINEVEAFRGLERAAAEKRRVAKEFLRRSDWFVIREIEIGKVIPPGIVAQRVQARTDAGQD